MRVKLKIKAVCILAIDPGKNGGIAHGISAQTLGTVPMPSTVHDLADVMAGLGADVIYLEKVHTTPQMGVVSAGSFMKGVGQIEGICATLKIPLFEVTPQKWMKYFELGKAKKRVSVSRKGKKSTVKDTTEWKKRLKARAQQIFPNVSITLGTADAVLIWEYARNTHKV